MNKSVWQKLRDLWRTEFFSPKDFVKRAVLLAALFALAHFCGLREFASVLNGTTGAAGMSWERSAFLGCLYIIVYLAFILLAPTLLLAAGILLAWRKATGGKQSSPNEPGTNPPTPD